MLPCWYVKPATKKQHRPIAIPQIHFSCKDCVAQSYVCKNKYINKVGQFFVVSVHGLRCICFNTEDNLGYDFV